MAKTKISEWSSTPANNTDIDSINIAEGCAPSGINDAIRELMAQVKDLYAGTTGDAIGVAGGGTGQTSYTDGQLLIGNSTGNTLTKATLTAGSGISVTNGGGSITIANTATGSQWTTSGSDIYYNTGVVAVGNSTPSAWGSGWKALQIGIGANFIGRTGVVNQLQLIANGYYNGTNYIYQNTGEATQYYQTGGTHVWATSASGTAGNAITFTQSLALGKGTTLALEGASSQSGTGITFPATQSASSNANTLDDYEEGTWTPSVGGTATYTAQQATYTKIGRVVHVTAYIQILLIGTGSTVQITGFPFVTATTSNFVNSARVETSATNIVSLNFTVGNTTALLRSRTAAAASDSTGSPIFQNSTLVELNGFYFV